MEPWLRADKRARRRSQAQGYLGSGSKAGAVLALAVLLAVPQIVSAVPVTQDDAGFTVAPPALTLAEGTSGDYTINLLTEPASPVTLDLAATPSGQCTVTPQVVLDETNWDSAVDNVTVTVFDDEVDESPHPNCVIAHTVTTDDEVYGELEAPEDYIVTVTDDDEAAVIIAPTQVELANAAVSATYSVSLATRPSVGAVTVVATFDPALLIVNGGSAPVTLVFATTAPQVLTVQGLADTFPGAYETTLITHAITASGALEYPSTMLLDSVVVGLGLVNPLANYPPQPPAPRCTNENFFPRSPVRASMPDAYNQSVFCRLLVVNGQYLNWFGAPLTHAGNIGSAPVVALEILQAVDVFSPTGLTQFEGGAVVCLRGSGRMIYLNGNQAPRVPQDIDTFRVDEFVGFSCVVLHEPGTLVLTRLPPTVRGGPATPPPPPAVTGIGTPLDGCMVRTRAWLNLRTGPAIDTESITLIHVNAILTAYERHDDWFLVDYYGTRGWLSGDYLGLRGTCDG